MPYTDHITNFSLHVLTWKNSSVLEEMVICVLRINPDIAPTCWKNRIRIQTKRPGLDRIRIRHPGLRFHLCIELLISSAKRLYKEMRLILCAKKFDLIGWSEYSRQQIMVCSTVQYINLSFYGGGVTFLLFLKIKIGWIESTPPPQKKNICG